MRKSKKVILLTQMLKLWSFQLI